jgi:hypothetical protein
VPQCSNRASSTLLTVAFLAGQDSDSPFAIEASPGISTDVVTRSARFAVESFAHSGIPEGTGPVGFLIENTQGDELHLWYTEARWQKNWPNIPGVHPRGGYAFGPLAGQ